MTNDQPADAEEHASRLLSLAGSLRIVLNCATECESNAEHLTSAIFLVHELEREIAKAFGAALDPD